MKRLLVATIITATAFVAGCTPADRSPDLGALRQADAPYYYLGATFDGLKVTDVLRYQRGQAEVLYGTCEPQTPLLTIAGIKIGKDGGCSLPLELQHRLCHGVVTISIFANRGRARRAAEALRPLSKGARARSNRPAVFFDRGVLC
jgi:hypothetical protein